MGNRIKSRLFLFMFLIQMKSSKLQGFFSSLLLINYTVKKCRIIPAPGSRQHLKKIRITGEGLVCNVKR